MYFLFRKRISSPHGPAPDSFSSFLAELNNATTFLTAAVVRASRSPNGTGCVQSNVASFRSPGPLRGSGRGEAAFQSSLP